MSETVRDLRVESTGDPNAPDRGERQLPYLRVDALDHDPRNEGPDDEAEGLFMEVGLEVMGAGPRVRVLVHPECSEAELLAVLRNVRRCLHHGWGGLLVAQFASGLAGQAPAGRSPIDG